MGPRIPRNPPNPFTTLTRIRSPGEPVQLRTSDRRRSLIPRRNRKAQDLLHAVARNPKIARCRALAHAVPTGEPDLPIQIHGENTPDPPCRQKGPKWPTFTPPAAGSSRRYRGRLLHRRSQPWSFNSRKCALRRKFFKDISLALVGQFAVALHTAKQRRH